MTIKFVSILASLLITGCSASNSDLSISCDGIFSDSYMLNGKHNFSERKMTKVFHFKKKSIYDISCSEWNKEKIVCSQVTSTNDGTETYSLGLDRIAGTISVTSRYDYKKDKSSLINFFQGKCIKLEGAKI